MVTSVGKQDKSPWQDARGGARTVNRNRAKDKGERGKGSRVPGRTQGAEPCRDVAFCLL